MKKIYILGVMVLGFAACKPNIEPQAPERGDADFTLYMSVGSGHTAGITDGSLYRQGQINSYPNILAQQLQTVGGRDFAQPLVPGEHGWPVGKLMLDYIQGPCDTVPRLDTRLFKGALDTTGTSRNIFADMGPFNNMGIPNSKTTDYLIPSYGNQNVYAARMFKTPGFSRPVDELLVPGYTFFSVWLGLSDILDYAMVGGNLPGVPNNTNVLPSADAFYVAYDSIINALTRNGAKGLLMTIPDVLDFPFFTAMSPRGLDLKAIDANKLNLQYNGTQVHFEIGRNYYVIEDENAPDGFRHIREDEYILLSIPHDSLTCGDWGTSVPIPHEWVLTLEEVQAINNAIGVFNSTIGKTAVNYNLALSDTRSVMQEITRNGIQYNGAQYSYDYMKGGFFSLDGIHLTGRGNAFLANSIIGTINSYYNSSIPPADVNAYEPGRIP